MHYTARAQLEIDERGREKALKVAVREFKALVRETAELGAEANAAYPARDKISIARRGRAFMKLTVNNRAIQAWNTKWTATPDEHSSSNSWHKATQYALDRP